MHSTIFFFPSGLQVWAVEAVNFPLNNQEVLTHGPARNARIFLRHGT
jgi:hypothetical protein